MKTNPGQKTMFHKISLGGNLAQGVKKVKGKTPKGSYPFGVNYLKKNFG